MDKAQSFAMQYGYYDKEKKKACCVGYNAGYKRAEKDIWDRIEKYLKTRYHMDYATVGWILDNIEYYKQKIMED